jgi:PAS domain-containing protein
MRRGTRDDLGLIGAFYDAAVNPALWPAAGERIIHALDAECITIQTQDPSTGATSILGFLGYSQSDLDCYAAHFSSKDPWIQSVLDRPNGEPFRFSDIVPETVLRAGEFYSDFLRPRCGVLRGIGSVFPAHDGRLVCLGIHRPYPGSDFMAGDVMAVAAMIPHLQSAVLLAGRWQQLELLATAGANALNALSTGIVVVDEAGYVILMNGVAQSLVNARDGLLIQSGRLEATTLADNAALATHVRRTIDCAAGRSTACPGALRVKKGVGHTSRCSLSRCRRAVRRSRPAGRPRRYSSLIPAGALTFRRRCLQSCTRLRQPKSASQNSWPLA